MRKFIVMAALMVGLAVGWWAVEAQTNPFYIAQSAQGIHITAGTLFPSATTTGQNPADGAVHIQLIAGATANPVMWIYSVDATAWVPVSPIGTGLASVPSTLVTNAVDVANSVWGGTGEVIFEGATADAFENEIRTADATVGVATFLLPDQAAAADIYPVMWSLLATNALDAAGSIWFDTNVLIAEGATANAFETTLTFSDVGQAMALTIDDYGVAAASFVPVLNATNVPEAANALWVDQARGIVYEGATVDAFETVVASQDPTVGVQTYAFVDRALAADTYEILGVPDVTWTTGNLAYDIDPIAAGAALAAGDNVMIVQRIYIPHTVTVTEVDVVSIPLANGSAADNTIAVGIYYDADAGAQIVEVVGATDDGAGGASQLETLDIADTTLHPGWYRIGFCAQDVTDHDIEGDQVHADSLLFLSAGAATGEMFGTGAVCVAGNPAATTGALTAAADAPHFMLRTQ